MRPSAPGTLSNQASVSSALADPSTANNSATAQTTVTAAPVGYPRPAGASPLRASLVPAYNECTAPNRTHGPPLDSASCNPPGQRSGFLTVGTPDANGRSASMVGSLRLSTVTGNPGTPADEANINIAFSTTDVRVAGTLVDYTGELQARAALRLTDRRTAPPASTPRPCPRPPTRSRCPAPPPAARRIGSTCSLTTTADALVPNTVVETKRSIWQLGEIVVMDGGSDGDAETTAGNTVFLRQGLFIP